jgi:hypothetical protein
MTTKLDAWKSEPLICMHQTERVSVYKFVHALRYISSQLTWKRFDQLVESCQFTETRTTCILYLRCKMKHQRKVVFLFEKNSLEKKICKHKFLTRILYMLKRGFK